MHRLDSTILALVAVIAIPRLSVRAVLIARMAVTPISAIRTSAYTADPRPTARAALTAVPAGIATDMEATAASGADRRPWARVAPTVLTAFTRGNVNFCYLSARMKTP